jgi:hypothetical protein
MLARFLAVGTALAGCTTPSSQPTDSGLQMNDLSILFPLPANDGELAAALGPSAIGVGGPLLPQTLFDEDNDATTIQYGGLHAVAFRLDPCFAHLGPITDRSTCAAQLRVVFQHVSDLGNGDIEADDVGVHAFYSLTNDQFDAAVHDVVAARLANGGDIDLGSLGVHPILHAQGLTGAFGTALTGIITKYAGAANLVKFTSLAGFEAGGGLHNVIPPTSFWSFEGFDIANNTTTPMVIPTLPNSLTAMSVSAGNTSPLAASIQPVTSSNDNIETLINSFDLGMATMAAKQSAFDAALRIQNPAADSPNTIDCGSCHLAQFAVQLVGTSVLHFAESGNANAFVADPAIPSTDLTPMTALVQSDGSINLHAFSYRGTGPMINQRVVNETAANLAYLVSQGL